MAKPKKIELLVNFLDTLSSNQFKHLRAASGQDLQRKDLLRILNKALKKRISTSSAKGKSRALQQLIAEMISNILFVPWGKDEEIASREMGQSGTDIRLSPRVLKGFPWSIECKDDAHISWSQAVRQAKKNEIPGTNWLLFMRKTSPHKEDKMPIVAILDAEVLFQLFKKLYQPIPLESPILMRRQK